MPGLRAAYRPPGRFTGKLPGEEWWSHALLLAVPVTLWMPSGTRCYAMATSPHGGVRLHLGHRQSSMPSSPLVPWRRQIGLAVDAHGIC